VLICIILEEFWSGFLSLGLLSPCAGAIKTASAPNSGRGQSHWRSFPFPRFPLRLALSLCVGDKGRSLSKFLHPNLNIWLINIPVSAS
jgi:hypothetical protein